MRDYSYLIPKNKFDDSTIDELMKISEEEVQPILLDLLEWIADINWPVARRLLEVLPRFHRTLVPLIKLKLKPTEADDILKLWIIVELIPLFPQETQKELLPDMNRIMMEPTKGELIEELPDYVKEEIEKMNMQ